MGHNIFIRQNLFDVLRQIVSNWITLKKQLSGKNGMSGEENGFLNPKFDLKCLITHNRIYFNKKTRDLDGKM